MSAGYEKPEVFVEPALVYLAEDGQGKTFLKTMRPATAWPLDLARANRLARDLNQFCMREIERQATAKKASS